MVVLHFSRHLPAVLAWEGLQQALKQDKETDLPLYDYRRSGRYGYLHVAPPDSQVVIVEGIYALHERVRGLVDLAISVSGGVHFDLVKRIFRGTCRLSERDNPSDALVSEISSLPYRYTANWSRTERSNSTDH